MNLLTALPILMPLLYPATLPATLPEPAPALSACQEADASASHDYPVVVWTPKNAHPHTMANTINELFVGGLISQDGQASRVRATAVDSVVIVTGPEPYVARAIELLNELDAKSGRESRATEYKLREVKVRHISMSDLRLALRPLERQVQQPTATGAWATADNLSFVHSSGSVIVHDEPDRVEQIMELIERLDVPRQQVLLRTYLIRGAEEGGGDPRIPSEAVEGLRALVPYQDFVLVSFGMVRSDVMAEMGMTDAVGGAEYRMVLTPDTYDAEARRLSLSSCRFDITRVEGTSRTTRQFATSASLVADEYTVLGGVGADADFLVLHMSLVAGD